MASSSNRRGATKTTLPWTTSEEITLCTAWCNAMDTYVMRDIHSRKGFWEKLFANFEKGMRGTIRGYDAIVSKWKNSIRLKVASFSFVSDSVRRTNENGSFDLVLFQSALFEYQTGYRQPFTMEAWPHSDTRSPVDRRREKTNMTLESQGPETLNGLPSFRFETIPDGLPPPENKDASQHVATTFKSLHETALGPLKRVLAKVSASYSPVTCMVADFLMYFALKASKELRIPGVLSGLQGVVL
nr:7-deoxyloganetin glucosyltransferase-like [Tanacetum cinerariifolium]